MDLASPQVKAADAAATAKTVTWLRDLLKREGSNLKVSPTPVKSLAGIGK